MDGFPAGSIVFIARAAPGTAKAKNGKLPQKIFKG
jgi:hypothetical protein